MLWNITNNSFIRYSSLGALTSAAIYLFNREIIFPGSKPLIKAALARTALLAELPQHFHRSAIGVADGHFERHASRERVRRATKTWIVGSESHLDHVQHAFSYHAALFDQ